MESVLEDDNFKGYHHIFEPQCFKNAFGETIIKFFNLTNQIAAKDANEVIDYYYYHIFNNLSHQTKEFKKEFIKHFNSFTGNNNESYITANTVASTSKDQDYQKCVKNLIQGLQSLSNIISTYFKNTYSNLYMKIKKLNLGSNIPKSFEIFPTVAINYNAISAFY